MTQAVEVRQIQGQKTKQITVPIDVGREYQLFNQVTMLLSCKDIKNSKSQKV